VKEAIANVLRTEPVRWGVKVVSQLPDRAQIALLRALAESGQLKVLEHPLAESRGHPNVLSQRPEETLLRRTMCQSRATRQRSADWRQSA
jgi:hypothetical protein